jgi:hypothetical protein
MDALAPETRCLPNEPPSGPKHSQTKERKCILPLCHEMGAGELQATGWGRDGCGPGKLEARTRMIRRCPGLSDPVRHRDIS